MSTQTRRDAAAATLARLEVRDCDCAFEFAENHGTGERYLVPCRHVRAAPDHGLSLAEWAALQRLHSPEDYDDPPPPATPGLALSTEARVEIMRRRAERGEGLYHPGDLWRDQPDDDGLRCGVEQKRAMNGADIDGTVRRAA